MGTMTTGDVAPTIDDELTTIIEAGIAAGEETCRPSEEVFDELRARGFCRMLVPSALGGSELPLPTVYRVIEDLSAIDGSVGWILNQSIAVTTAARFFEKKPEGVFDDPDLIAAGTFWPPGGATDAEGGMRFTNQCAFGTGSTVADWLFVSAVRMVDGEPVVDPETEMPEMVGAYVPRGDFDIIETWDPTGMRGTGSHDVTVTDAFVPSARITHMVGASTRPRPEEWSNPMFELVPWINMLLHACVPIGIARAALAEATDLVQEKIPNFYEATLATKGTVLAELAECRARLDAASSYVRTATEAAVDEVAETGSLTVDRKSDLQLASTFGAEAASGVAEALARVAATTAVKSGTTMERRLRDIRTIVHHAGLQHGRYESVGQTMVGGVSDWFPYHV